MQRSWHLTQQEKKEIVVAYQDNLVPMQVLAEKYRKSRASIWKTLQKAGIDTTKRKLAVICYACGKEVMKTKSQIRNSKLNYCTFDCYMEYIKETGQPYVQNRHGQRRARALVNTLFKLNDGMIVHHENKDNLDNRVTNLRVFKNHSEHMGYHRGNGVLPVWDGRKI